MPKIVRCLHPSVQSGLLGFILKPKNIHKSRLELAEVDRNTVLRQKYEAEGWRVSFNNDQLILSDIAGRPISYFF